MAKPHVHRTHPEVVKRLRRAEGHLHAIIAMIESERRCLDIAQQLHAVEKAMCAAKKLFIHDHLDHCLEQVVKTRSSNRPTPLDEFRDITKFL